MAGFGDIEERFYTCSICMSPFEDPKSLPCLHTFCEGCLRDYTESRGFSRNGSFPCPQCRNETTIPHGGVREFPSNYQLLELIEHIRQNVAGTAAVTPPAPPTYSYGAEAPPSYSQVWGQATPTSEQAPPTSQQGRPSSGQGRPSSGQGRPSSGQGRPSSGQGRPSSGQAPPPRPASPRKESGASPIQRTLHVNPSDHAVPIHHNEKHALLVFGCRGNNLTHFTTPVGLTNVADKYIVISDQRCNRVLVFGLDGQIKSMFTCHGLVQGIASDPNGNVLIANPNIGRALAKSFTLQGQTKSTIGNQFTHEKPHGIAASRANVAISSLETNKVFVFDPNGRLIRELGGTGSRKMQLRSPFYLAINSSNDVIVSDSGNHAIKVFAAGSGKHKLTIGGTKGSRPGELNTPLGVAVDRANNIVVCDSGNHRVQSFSPQGKFLGVIAKGILGGDAVPRDLAIFSGLAKMAVLVAGQDMCEVRVYAYGKDSKVCACS